LSRVAPAEHFWFPEAFRPRQNRRDAGIDIKKVIGQRLVAIQVAATKATRQWGQIFTFDISFSRAVRISRSVRSFHLPGDADMDGATAKLNNSTLIVRVPKHHTGAAAGTRRVPVE
jgi:hypothetical protein